MCDCQSTYLKKKQIIKSISWVEAGQLSKMCDYQSTYFKRTRLSSQFLGLKQGNWAKCVTFVSRISKEPYYQINFLGWSRAIGQNVWLSFHLSQRNHNVDSISWVEAGQFGKMCDSWSTYLKRTLLSSLFLGLKQGNWAKCVTVNATFLKKNRLSSQFLGLKQGNCDCQSTYLKRNIGAVRRHLVAVRRHPGAVCCHPGAVCRHPGAVRHHPGGVSKELYCQDNFLGWSRAIGQNVWLSILSQRKYIIASFSWVEAG